MGIITGTIVASMGTMVHITEGSMAVGAASRMAGIIMDMIIIMGVATLVGDGVAGILAGVAVVTSEEAGVTLAEEVVTLAVGREEMAVGVGVVSLVAAAI